MDRRLGRPQSWCGHIYIYYFVYTTINYTISQAPLMTPVKTFAYFRLRQWSGSSTNSVMGLVSKCRENSSPAGLQFVIEGVTPRNNRKPICKKRKFLFMCDCILVLEPDNNVAMIYSRSQK
jgi:hypothetical protein